LRERQRGALASLQGTDPGRPDRAAAQGGARRRARGVDRAGGTRRLRPGQDDRGGAAEPAVDPSRAARRDHLPGQDDYADGIGEPPAAAPRLALLVPRGGETRLLPELSAVPRRPPRRPGTLRARLQPAPRELPGQRHDRAAHRELRLLARRERRAWTAARGYALELGDAGMGRLLNGAGDLVGHPVSVRADGVDSTHVGENGKRETGSGKREGPVTARRAGLALLLALARVPFPVSRLPAQDTTHG